MPILGISASGGLVPGAPTIGTATDGGTGTSASITFTAPTWPGKGSGTVTYTATSSPGSITGTSTSSPVTVSGLTTGTAYTFTVKATTSYGVTGPASAASNSVTPATPSSYDSIATYTVGSGGTSVITFSSIPQTYKHLQLRLHSRTNGALTRAYLQYFINGDTSTTNYSFNYMMGTGSGVMARDFNSGGSQQISSLAAGDNYASNIFAGTVTDILDYTSTNKTKVFRTTSGIPNAAPNTMTTLYVENLVNTTSAITQITIQPTSGYGTSLMQGGIYALYGIKG
jgi:hypothetical protein